MNDMSLCDDRDDLVAECRQVGKVTLAALPSYWRATPEQKAQYCNGAGPAWLQELLPWWLRWLQWLANSLWGLDCTEPFEIHDWDYAFLPPKAHWKVAADERLRANLMRTIHSRPTPTTRRGRLLRWARIHNAGRYLNLVRKYGFKAYFDRPQAEGTP